MEPHDLPVDSLLRVLPDIAELAPLREAILGASVPDPTDPWASSRAYVTFDKRILPAAQLDEVVRRTAEATHERVERLYRALSGVLAAIAADDAGTATARLVELGQAAEGEERWVDATNYYDLAVRLSKPLPDHGPLSLALRRLARARFGVGDIEAAFALYRRSCEAATAAEDRRGELAARLGLGNMRSFQGRWAEAQAHYESALALCEEADTRVRGQLYNNLSMVCRERGLLSEAQHWLDRAGPVWVECEERADRSVWWNNRGLLRLALGDFDQAGAAFHHAFEDAPSHFDRAMVLDNLAELAIRRGLITEAEGAARRAEEYALAAGSPRALAEVYTRLGKVCRLRGDPNGVAFFEKALELCRPRHYPLVEGHAHLEYGLFRRALGEAEEARAYLEEACRVFERLGAVADLERARRELDDAVVRPPAVGRG